MEKIKDVLEKDKGILKKELGSVDANTVRKIDEELYKVKESIESLIEEYNENFGSLEYHAMVNHINIYDLKCRVIDAR